MIEEKKDKIEELSKILYEEKKLNIQDIIRILGERPGQQRKNFKEFLDFSLI